MLLQDWAVVFTTAFQDMWSGIVDFVPRLVVALIIFIIGWVLGVALGRVVAQIFRAVKLDNLLRSIGTEELLSRAGFKLDSGAFLGGLVKWFVIVIFLIASAVVAEAVQKLVVGSAKAANIPSAHFMGGIARWAIWIFAILAALG